MAKVKIQGHASGTGVLTVTAPNTSTDRTITLPDSTGTLATTADSVGGANGVDFNDNVKARFGTGDDLEIYHDGNNSYVKDTGDGDLYLMGADEVLIRSATNENMIKAVANAQVNLYYDNALKLATSAAGVTVTGDLLVKSAGANASIKLTDSDNNVDGYVYATGGDVGFLDDDGNWAYRIDTDTNHKWMINDATEMLLESDGDLHVDGDVIAYSTSVSDERLKDNIKVVDSALDKVKELKGVTFTRKQDGVESAGVIAQDVEKVLPQAVKHKALPLQTGNDELFKTVQYDALHALLIEAVKELSEKVEKLENK